MGGSRFVRRTPVLAFAALLFAAIFGARFVDPSQSSGITILYVVPVVLAGVQLGRRAGIAAGLVALGLFAAWTPFSPIHIAPSAYIARGIAFVLVGAVSGHLADRLRSLALEAQASARHFALSRELLCTASFDGYLTHLNGAWEQCLGWTREELMAQPFIEFVHPDDRDGTVAEAARLAEGELTVSFANRYRTKGGEWRWIEWSSRADPERREIHAAARDVTERRRAEEARREAEERLRFLAEHDPLSGLFNRRRFEGELRRELDHHGRRDRRSVLLLLDVDDFKAINDTFGHATGDAVIAQLGELLQRRARTGDAVARLGGDEFAVLLRRLDVPAATEIARTLQARAGEQLAEIAGRLGRPVTLSVGLARIGGSDEPLSVDALLSRADHALYAAKRAGKDRVVADGDAAPLPAAPAG